MYGRDEIYCLILLKVLIFLLGLGLKGVGFFLEFMVLLFFVRVVNGNNRELFNVRVGLGYVVVGIDVVM